jgi:alginate O-acetyltransferase complex protein AlgI
MIFTDLRFVLLFVVFGALFALAPRRWRMAVLALWGIAFYALYAGWALYLVLALVALVFASKRLRVFCWPAGLAIAGVLAYFKIAQANGVADLIVPLGLSYLSFELLHVAIERHRGRLADMNPIDLLAFAFFAPARIAGPIKRFPQFVQAVRDAEVSATSVYAGLLRVLSGLAKKYLLADVLALTAAESRYTHSMQQAWTVVLAYSLQIYFDFSAYSDIAIGLAQILGIRLPENFDWPYLSRNIRQFWERWHITLSQWVRDYVFVPAGRGLFRTKLRPWPAVIAAISYLVTFTVVGAWHGVTPGFLVWGAYHGVLLTLYHIARLKTPRWISDHRWYDSRLTRGLSTALTFLLVTVGWVPFMLPLGEARKLLAWMFGVSG